MILKRLHSFFNPEQYQGWGKTRNYFEGWYYKVVDRAESNIFAIIPGIAMDERKNSHAFIQVLDGRNHTSEYHRFSPGAFRAAPGKFEIEVSGSFFSERSLELNLPELRGKIEFSGNVPWPKPFYSPGIMGPYSFVPFMECHHGIISMDHETAGCLETRTETIDFTGGRGYIEKDWGRSFPSAYVWMQTNHFGSAGISFKASVAKIPWTGNYFTGFIAGLWHNNHLMRFTTYNNTKLEKLEITPEEVILVLKNKCHRIEAVARRKEAAMLASPVRGLMEGRIEETMKADVTLRLTSLKDNGLLLEDAGRNAGLEVAGNIHEIVTGTLYSENK